MTRCEACDERTQAGARYCHRCGAELGGTPVRVRKVRKVVTVLFSDLVDSTTLGEQLDEESLAIVLSRYYDSARRVMELHGGTVQKFVGDAVVAVFGIPRLHEDDAARAVRAALALRDALAGLNRELEREWRVWLDHRTGVNTGAVVVRDPAKGEAVTLGDAVNVAARLQQAASRNEILIGHATHELVRDLVLVEAVPELRVRGRERPVAAWRLLGVRPHPGRSASASELVGRDEEQGLLRLAYQRAVTHERGHLVTVRGAIGVGKTRLIDEFVDQAAAFGPQPKVLRTRCPPFGPGPTYGPLAQLLRQAAGIRGEDPPERQRELLADLAEGDRRVTARVAGLLGLDAPGGEPEDTLRALCRVLELLARRRPLVVVVDDFQWAPAVLLDFLRRAVEVLSDEPALLVCLARLELFDDRQTWGWTGSLPNVLALQLPPLGPGETDRLVARLLGVGQPADEVGMRIREATAGYPLFVEELVKSLVDDGALRRDGDRWVATTDLSDIPVPPTVEALLAARLDRLPPPERLVIERAAVVGTQFRGADVAALSPDVDAATIASALRALARKELLREVELASTSGRARQASTFRFRHSQLQDTAYRGIAKEARARLHERYAQWLEERGGQPGADPGAPGAVLAGQIGFHLDRAYGDRLEVGRDHPATRALALRAGERLATAGHELVHSNFPEQAIPLLARTFELLPRGAPAWLAAALDLGDALRYRDLLEAQAQYEDVIRAAREVGDERVEHHGTLGLLEVSLFSRSGDGDDPGHRDVDAAMRVFERLGDDRGLAKAWRLRAHLDSTEGASTRALEAAGRAVEHARRAGDVRLEASCRRLYGVILHWGPRPLEESLRVAEADIAWAREQGLYGLEAGALSVMARCRAMLGDVAAARQCNREARAVIPDLGELLTFAADSISEGVVELLADDPDAAERALRRGCEALRQRGGTGPLANAAALLARALIRQGRYDEAEHFIEVSRELADPRQVDTQVKWREHLAVVLSRRGELDEAERLAREAVRLSERCEQLDTQAEARTSLAEVLREADRASDAVPLLEQALDRYERKGNAIATGRLKRLLDRVSAT